MGLLDRLLHKTVAAGTAEPAAKPAPPQTAKPRAFSQTAGELIRPDLTPALAELFATPRERRSAAWQGAFFQTVWTASLQLAEPASFQGPDGFRYIRLHIADATAAHEATSLAKVAQSLVNDTAGAAIFRSADATEPEWVMSMGVLDSILRYDSWQGDPLDLADLAGEAAPKPTTGNIQTFTTEAETQILLGSPSPAYLPPGTARALYLHLRDVLHVQQPRVALMMNPATRPTRSLVLNRKLSHFRSELEAGTQARLLLWYLPPRRGLVLMPETWNEDQMKPLLDFFPAGEQAEATA